ncbi:hypothetical protein SAMN05216417_11062 [Nitrosospira multiformis]|uniref:Uncharacterized protein n=1 Tax=Nitrosospira multiformis TaxID=1231 RepID=A0A1I7HLS2_9PROT|nr:hypothetical protein SAMN05216417_11062 [Nitrosospira multiformis]
MDLLSESLEEDKIPVWRLRITYQTFLLMKYKKYIKHIFAWEKQGLQGVNRERSHTLLRDTVGFRIKSWP